MIRRPTRLASDSPPALFPCQLSSKSFRPKLLRTLFALSHATARSKPCVFSCLRTLCRHNGGSIGLSNQISQALLELFRLPLACLSWPATGGRSCSARVTSHQSRITDKSFNGTSLQRIP